MNQNRVRLLQNGEKNSGPVIYWISRDQRVYENWALIFAQLKAAELKKDLVVVFNLLPEFLEATIRQYGFMLKGLEEVEKNLKELNIPFLLLQGDPVKKIPEFVKEIDGSILVSDFDPLKIKRRWKRDIAKKLSIPFYEVDAHNIVPCLYVSDKEEYAAYTIRPKIHKALPEFLDEFPELQKMNRTESFTADKIDWENVKKNLKVNRDVEEIDWIKPGYENGQKVLNDFLENKLENYNEQRNDPTKDYQSNLSSYLHFGQISAQQVALTIDKRFENNDNTEAFLEELIIRKELSDNFCYYNHNYDSITGFKDWAKETLEKHKDDEREFIYTKEEFENAETHEDLWNAAQMELVKTGKMHGYMRMYWAKKILEWTNTPQYALNVAIYLNDKYELDGRDPNGYTGCAWSVGGIHDRAWTERPVYGKIRYMNRNGAKRKFDIDAYIKKFS